MKRILCVRTGIHSVLICHVGASVILLAPTFCAFGKKVRVRSFRCSSSPGRTRMSASGLAFGAQCESWHYSEENLYGPGSICCGASAACSGQNYSGVCVNSGIVLLSALFPGILQNTAGFDYKIINSFPKAHRKEILKRQKYLTKNYRTYKNLLEK